MGCHTGFDRTPQPQLLDVVAPELQLGGDAWRSKGVLPLPSVSRVLLAKLKRIGRRARVQASSAQQSMVGIVRCYLERQCANFAIW